MAIHYDGTINAGHIMTASVIMFSVASAVIWVQADLSRLTSEQAQFEASFASDIFAIRAESQGRETRLRAVEVSQAAQSSDLRAIQASLGRIERLIEALP